MHTHTHTDAQSNTQRVTHARARAHTHTHTPSTYLHDPHREDAGGGRTNGTTAPANSLKGAAHWAEKLVFEIKRLVFSTVQILIY